MPNNQPYWKHGYGKLICSECGYVIKEDDDLKRYIDYRHNKKSCPGCNADMREPLKRCYLSEYYPDTWQSCGEIIFKDGVPYCYKQTKERREELLSWGYYFKCEGFKPKSAEQITFY